MKRLCLFFCFGFILFWGSMSIAVATPIHDGKNDSGFISEAERFEHGNRYCSGGPASDCFADFPGQSGIDTKSLGSVVSAYKIEKNTRKPKHQNQYESMEGGGRVSNPVPASLFLLGTGLIGLAAFRRKRPVQL